jgi:hypothetical protein
MTRCDETFVDVSKNTWRCFDVERDCGWSPWLFHPTFPYDPMNRAVRNFKTLQLNPHVFAVYRPDDAIIRSHTFGCPDSDAIQLYRSSVNTFGCPEKLGDIVLAAPIRSAAVVTRKHSSGEGFWDVFVLERAPKAELIRIEMGADTCRCASRSSIRVPEEVVKYGRLESAVLAQVPWLTVWVRFRRTQMLLEVLFTPRLADLCFERLPLQLQTELADWLV